MIRRSKNKINLFLLSGLVLSLFFIECRESASGCCKDSFATNFDPMAEENTCCTYPAVDLSLIHKFSGTAPSGNDTCYSLLNISDGILIEGQPETDSFEILSSSWFFRDIELFDGTDWIPFSEQVEIPVGDSMFMTYPKNFTVNEFTSYRVSTISTTDLVGEVGGMRYTLGWDTIVIDTAESRISTITDLSRAKSQGLIDENGHILMGRIEMLRKSDSMFYEIKLSGEISNSLFTTAELIRGYDRRIDLSLDYTKLLENINLDQNVNEIENVIKTNLTNHGIQIDAIY